MCPLCLSQRHHSHWELRNPSYGEQWPKCQWLQQELKKFLETLPSTASASDLHAGFSDDSMGFWMFLGRLWNPLEPLHPLSLVFFLGGQNNGDLQ